MKQSTYETEWATPKEMVTIGTPYYVDREGNLAKDRVRPKQGFYALKKSTIYHRGLTIYKMQMKLIEGRTSR